jgi:protein O-GlcNAc transferase
MKKRIPSKAKSPLVSNPQLHRLLARNSSSTRSGGQPLAVDRRAFLNVYELFTKGELIEADPAIDHLLLTHPDDRYCLNLKAVIAASLHRVEIAESIWKRVLQRHPDDVEALSNLGTLYQAAGQLGAAEFHLKQALVLNPQHFNSHLNLGNVYLAQCSYDEAILSYKKALLLNPQFAQAHFNIGNALREKMLFLEAHAAYARALEIDPAHYGARSNLLFTHHYLPNFDPAENKRQAEILASTLTANTSPTGPQSLAVVEAVGVRPLRIGFVSADLRTHPVGFFLRDVIGHLANKQVQLFAYSNSRVCDTLTDELKPVFAKWNYVIDISDTALAQLIIGDHIDILIDLSGHSAGNRLACLAARLAPIQMSWLGYFSTTGLSTIDYVIADPYCLPDEDGSYFTEKILRMPHSRYCFSPLTQYLSDRRPPSSRQEGVVFGCFQSIDKINGRVLKCWAQILATAYDARLRLQARQFDHSSSRTIFVEQLQLHGLAPERVELVGNMKYEDYLQSYSEVDLLLDTFPYPGGTTSAEAIWMGVPTLTLATPGMLGRQGAAIMSNVGLSHWVCHSEAEYVAQAISLARREGPLWSEIASLRAQSPERVRTYPLFDAPRFANDLNYLLQSLWQDIGSKM